MIVLSASNLTKIYGTDVIVKGVDFHINSGDRVGLIGRNGAGKTTLLNMISGQLMPDEGQIFLSAGTRIGYLKQRDSFDPENTVMGEIENVFVQIRKLEEDINKTADQISQNPGDESLLNRLYRLQHEFEARGGYTYRSEATGILTSMALGPESYDKKIKTLSGGERTWMSLAALRLEMSDVLVLDEPTNHLDIGMLKWLEQFLS